MSWATTRHRVKASGANDDAKRHAGMLADALEAVGASAPKFVRVGGTESENDGLEFVYASGVFSVGADCWYWAKKASTT